MTAAKSRGRLVADGNRHCFVSPDYSSDLLSAFYRIAASSRLGVERLNVMETILLALSVLFAGTTGFYWSRSRRLQKELDCIARIALEAQTGAGTKRFLGRLDGLGYFMGR